MRLDINLHVEAAAEALRRLDEISRKQDLILRKESNIMSIADDLNNGMTSLATGFAALDAAVQAQLSSPAMLEAAKTNAAVAQAIANIDAITGKMATDAAALTASIPAATTVPPPVLPPPVVNVPPAGDIIPDIATPPITAPTATPPSTPPASATTVP